MSIQGDFQKPQEENRREGGIKKETLEGLYRAFSERLGEKALRREAPLWEHVSFRVGGPCRLMVFPQKEEEIAFSAELCRQEGVPFFILGRGTNLLPSDEGYEGVVIKLGAGFDGIREEAREGSLYAQAGALLSSMARAALERSLTGLEFAAGIPGTLGGGVVMNAGAYDGQLGSLIRQVRTLGTDGKIRCYSREECGFSYRHSIFQDQKQNEIILGASVSLLPGETERIREKMEDFSRRRSEKQPLSFPSAGSTFKRPPGHFAGQLIEEAGLKGLSVGGAMVSTLHAGFIINQGNAAARDIMDLILLVRDTVADRRGILLEPEVKLLGWEETPW